MIAARQIAFGKAAGGGWQNPNITDGLAAMWDGEWNAGGGKHDANATTWVDVARGLAINVPTGAAFGSKSLVFSSVSAAARTDVTSALTQFLESDELTAEWVMKYASTGSKQVFNICSGSAFEYLVADLLNGSSITHYPAHGFTSGGWGSYQKGISADTLVSMSDVWTRNGNETTYYNGAIHNTLSAVDAAPHDALTVVLGGGHYALANGAELYCVRLYSRALTAEEIAYNYSIDKARFGL